MSDKMKKTLPYVSVSTKGGVYSVMIREGISPLAKVIEIIPCGSYYEAKKTAERVKRDIGIWL